MHTNKVSLILKSFSLFTDGAGRLFSDNPYENDFHELSDEEITELKGLLEFIVKTRQQAAN